MVIINDKMNHKQKIIANLKGIKAMIFIVAFNLFVLMSCNHHEMPYAEYVEFEAETWKKNEIVEYKLELNDSTEEKSINEGYELFISLRHTTKYQYKDLWIEAKIYMIDSIENVDTLQLCLIRQDSRWTGKGYGGVYELNQRLKNSNQISKIRTIALRHIMSDSVLCGIKNLGIIVTNNR